MRVSELQSIRIKLASPEEILSWSKGEVQKPETINYRTLRPEKDGLFCEKIFGPTTDFQCYCGKYKGIRYKGIVCDRCGVEITRSSVRRERMGHIKLACPCAHIWFLRSMPSAMSSVLNISRGKIERIVYFTAYIITSVSEETKNKILEKIEKEYSSKNKGIKAKNKDKKDLRISLNQLDQAKEKAIARLDKIKLYEVLSELEYQNISLKYGAAFTAETGGTALYNIFSKIDLKQEISKLKKELDTISASMQKKTIQRLRLFQGMLNGDVRPEWMFLTILPVLPPDLRPMVQLDGGRYASSDLNDLYRRVINRNNRLKYLFQISAPTVIIRNEQRMLQEAIDALIDNGMRTSTLTRATTGGRRLLKSLADMLKGKKGRFRRSLLGKRVDYSGRSVIVVGPELRLDQVGLPKEMALELFKPFVIKNILEKELAYNVRGASRLVEEQIDEVWEILEDVVKNRLVLLNRAPTLHRISIQAFQPVLVEGKAIRIHPLVCSAFNADFDGDQMAVHVPLSKKAQKEAKDIMLSTHNLLKPANGRPIVDPNQDIILGCYWMSKIKKGAKGEKKVFSGGEEALLAYEAGYVDLKAEIQIPMPFNKTEIDKNKEPQKPGLVKTSIGRIMVNNVLPKDFPFQNEVLDSKKLEKITWEIIEKYGNEQAAKTLDEIKHLGFEYSTISGLSLGIGDFVVPPQKTEIMKIAEIEVEKVDKLYKKGFLSREERLERVIEIWTKVKSKITELLPQILPEHGPVFTIADSGCRGSWIQPAQMAGMKGLVVNPSGKIIELPVKHSFKEGLGVLEYFISTHGARKGTADTALGTSKAGYLTRRLVDVAHEIAIREQNCGDDVGLVLFAKSAKNIGQDFSFKIVGRTTLEDIKNKNNDIIVKKGDIIDWKQAEKIVNNEIKRVRVRSPLTCKSMDGVCQKCYGWDLGKNVLVGLGEAVGVVAAQAIGEPGTQLTMRTFHTGGVAGGGDITGGLPRADEVLEVRSPKGKAFISEVDGKVLSIKDKVVKIKPNKPNKSKTKKTGSSKDKTGILEYNIPEYLAIWVKAGDDVYAGQQLCEGNIVLKELFKVGGMELTQRYIVREVQKVYVSQGVKIHDKHIEIIARQMFSRVRVKLPGDSLFSPGEIVEKSRLLEINKILKGQKKKLAVAREVLLGISNVALTTDSFLSAASFQRTSNILIKASLQGKEDKLRGLKENVMIGKLIPVGTGFKK